MNAPQVTSLREQAQRWLAGNPEDGILRWLYRGLIVATLAVLALDYADIETGVAKAPARRSTPPANTSGQDEAQ